MTHCTQPVGRCLATSARIVMEWGSNTAPPPNLLFCTTQHRGTMRQGNGGRGRKHDKWTVGEPPKIAHFYSYALRRRAEQTCGPNLDSPHPPPHGNPPPLSRSASRASSVIATAGSSCKYMSTREKQTMSSNIHTTTTQLNAPRRKPGPGKAPPPLQTRGFGGGASYSRFP